jgi:uncharacterized protein (DUF2267 family)
MFEVRRLHDMHVAELYDRVARRLPADGAIEADPEELVHAVLASLADRLSPNEAAELGAELPDEWGDVLAGASGDGTLTHDEFIEDVAARLDLDDDDAESVAKAVLQTVREAIEPMVSIEQVLETLPTDLAQMMHG